MLGQGKVQLQGQVMEKEEGVPGTVGFVRVEACLQAWARDMCR